MIHSMTGYARAEAAGDWGGLAWELRSVNHRYLDLSLRIPEALREIEPYIRARATAQLGRGKVECTLRYNAETAVDGLQIDSERLAALADGCRRAAEELDNPGPVDPLRALQWPGVVREAVVDNEALLRSAQDVFDEALEQLGQNRLGEGEKLDAFLRERLRDVEALTERVQARLPQVQSEWRQRLESKLAELDEPVDSGRVEQEIVIAAQKADVEEELSRLRMHVSAFAEALSKDGPVGRRLDFLMQEFNREANTLSSKSQDAQIRQWAVDMKVVIEQMREQVQNVE